MTEKYEYNREKLPRPVLSSHPEWLRLYDYAWETAFKNVDYIDKAGWKPQLTCYPGIGVVWQWDSCFMTMITNYSNGTLSALNNLDNMYRLQRGSDGYISMAYRIAEEKEAYDEGRINPPLYAWAEWQHFAVTGDSSRFERVLPIIEAFYGYIEARHRRISGLYWFDDPGSSGMDNSPRGEYPSSHLDGSGLCHIDLACQQALSAGALAKMYAVSGKREKADFYNGEHKRICDLINKYHWNGKTGFYYDFFSRENAEDRVKLLPVKTVAAAWTLLCGAAKGERFERTLGHFLNPDEFNTLMPFASLSRDDLNYDPKGGYWLGGVWPPTDYVLIKAMADNGYIREANEAAKRVLNGAYSVFSNSEYGGIWEVYAPEEYKPATIENGSLCKPDFVGWGGLIPITMLIENIIGLKFNAPENTVEFTVFNSGDSGIENMRFAGNRVSVVCRNFDIDKRRGELFVKTEKPLKVRIGVLNGEKTEFDLEAGEHTLLPELRKAE